MKDKNGRCLANIETLCKRRRKTKKELEEAAGLSEGYLSRCKKEGKIPKLNALFVIADMLGVTADLLVRYRIDKLNDDDLRVYLFIHELYLKTMRMAICWRIYDPAAYDKPAPPLPQLEDGWEYGKRYYADLNGKNVVFLMCCKASVNIPDNYPPFMKEHFEKEAEEKGDIGMYLADGDNVKFVCSGKGLKGKLSDHLYNLYRLAKDCKTGKHLFLDEEVRSMLRAID